MAARMVKRVLYLLAHLANHPSLPRSVRREAGDAAVGPATVMGASEERRAVRRPVDRAILALDEVLLR